MASMIKPSRRGLLHKKLGVPQGQKIPKAKLAKALHSTSPALRKEANFARNFGKKKGAPPLVAAQNSARADRLAFITSLNKSK